MLVFDNDGDIFDERRKKQRRTENKSIAVDKNRRKAPDRRKQNINITKRKQLGK
ncbi:MAG: hypothetical protein FWF46_02600 [Oscillospiraceae bacterium]|nr:hypothetical protein [Oscillospiraceae bacterium]